MNRKEYDLLLSRIEGLKAFLENRSLEEFQKEILKVESYLKRFGSLDELLSHLERVERIAYVAKDLLTSLKEFTVYKPNGKTIFILRDDLNDWIKRNPYLSNRGIEQHANLIAYQLKQDNTQKKQK